MDTLAALALATDPATEKLLERKPDKKTPPFFQRRDVPHGSHAAYLSDRRHCRLLFPRP